MGKKLWAIILACTVMSGIAFSNDTVLAARAEEQGDLETLATEETDTNSFENFKIGAYDPDGIYYYETPVNRLKLIPGIEFNMTLNDEQNSRPVYEGFQWEGQQLFTESSAGGNGSCYRLDDNVAPGIYVVKYESDNVTASLTFEVAAYNADDLKIAQKAGTPSSYEFVGDSKIFSANEQYQFVLLSDYQIDGKTIFYSAYPKPVNVQWSSSNGEIAEVNSDGLLKTKNIGDCVITAKTGSGENSVVKTLTVSVKKEGIYVKQHESVMTVPAGSYIENVIDSEVIGSLVPERAGSPLNFEINMIFDEDTINSLNAENMLGDWGQTFIPNPNRHTIASVKGISRNIPYIVQSKQLTGMWLNGYIVYPKKDKCSHFDTSSRDDFEDCDCYKNEENLNDVIFTDANGVETTTKKVPFSIHIVENNVEENMKLVEKINTQNTDVTLSQKAYLSSLLCQIATGHGVSETGQGEIQFPPADYSTKNLEAITEAAKKAGIKTTYSMPEGITVKNLITCLKVNSDGAGVQIPEQEISFNKNESSPGPEAEALIDSKDKVLGCYDFTIEREVKKGESGTEQEKITETTVPLQVTVNLGEDLTGKSVSVIREHQGDKGTEAEIIDAVISGHEATFESDKYSTYTFVKTAEDGKDVPKKPVADTGQKDDMSGRQGVNETVQTGDNSAAGFWGVLCAVCAFAIAVVYRKRRSFR